MKFNIARQTLVPAFLTLVALAAFAMWSAGSPAGDLPVGNPSPTGGELALSTPAELLARFQAACPGWSRWIGGFLILFVGMSLGRLTVRYNLYSVGTCLAIPLYGAITAGLKFGSFLLSHLSAVPSALAGLTSLFGMGRGGAPPLLPPECFRDPRNKPRTPYAGERHRVTNCRNERFGLLVRVGFGVAAFTPPAYRRGRLPRPSWRSHLGDGFALRCFQRLS